MLRTLRQRESIRGDADAHRAKPSALLQSMLGFTFYLSCHAHPSHITGRAVTHHFNRLALHAIPHPSSQNLMAERIGKGKKKALEGFEEPEEEDGDEDESALKEVLRTQGEAKTASAVEEALREDLRDRRTKKARKARHRLPYKPSRGHNAPLRV